MFGDVKGQEDSRHVETFRDNHGRPYRSEVENKNGMPTVIEPLFKAPIGPDWMRNLLAPPVDNRNIVKVLPPKLRGLKGYAIEIDYDAWIAAHDKRFDEWSQKLYEGAKTMAKGRDAQDIADNPPPVLRSELGAPPFPPRTLILAMKAGNPWALGLDDKVPAKAEALLAELEQWVGRKRRRPQLGNAIVDPFADDEEETPNVFDEARLDADLDPLIDLEEAVDPQALGRQSGRPPKPTATTWQQFLKQQLQAGKTMQEASALWKQRKKQAA